ncbi:unnamed protein product [Victoria cruziana]
MGRQWSAGKLVLILDIVHWNPDAPPRMLLLVRLRRFLFPQINKEGRSQLILPKNWKNCFEDQNWGSQCFSTTNEIRQPRDALLLTPKGSEMELNLSLG